MNIFNPDFKSVATLIPAGDSVLTLDYLIATYQLTSRTTLRNAAWELAIGQSVGNPKIRSRWESEELFQMHSCIVVENEAELASKKSGIVKIAFPLANINIREDGVSQLLCQLMGGQMDIDDIVQCHLLKIEFPQSALAVFKGPKFGIDGIRSFTGVYNKPLLGGIIKPKVLNSVDMLLDMTKELVDGGVNFIKEDEIMSSPLVCPLEQRVKAITKYIHDKNVIYCFCINADAPYILDRAKRIYEMGGNGIHVNFWSGLGSYKALRDLDLPLFLHFQKSGDKVLTDISHKYHIEWEVICDLAGLMGVDTIHAGMWGGYMDDSEESLRSIMTTLHSHNTMPALSCGFHPGLVDAVTERFGIDYMANAGGAIHGHPNGTKAGAAAMRQAIDKNYGTEYHTAIQKWGKK